MTTRPEPFITSVRVEPSNGPHEYVSIWIRGQQVGTLRVGKGDGEPLAAILRGDAPPAPIMIEPVGPMVIEGHEPPPGNWAFFEGPREIIDSLLAAHGYSTAEAGQGAPAPSPPAANQEPGLESRPPGAPSAAGAPPTYPNERCTDQPALHPPRRVMPIGGHCPKDLTPDELTLRVAAQLGIHDAKLDHIVRDFVSYWTGPAGHTLLSDWQGKLRRRLYELQSDRQHFETARQNAIEDSWREEETLP